jgi:undecaprenyl-diphosphatase
METWQVIFLGILEGATEFLPVSSTGHLLLAEHFLGIKSTGRTFEVLIQLGAILAILSVYSAKLMRMLIDLPRDARTRRFVLAVLVAFLPAAVIGATLHKFIKGVLFESPTTVCLALVIGGFILITVDRWKFEHKYHDVMDLPVKTALIIGFCQCLAMIPGVSRSGSTIVGAMLLGADKRTSAEFSIFLAMPTMAGAFAYDLYKNYAILKPEDVTSIALGFVVAFVAGVIVVRYLLEYVSRHGFAVFAWWRILVGGAGLGALAVIGG